MVYSRCFQTILKRLPVSRVCLYRARYLSVCGNRYFRFMGLGSCKDVRNSVLLAFF